MTSAALLAYLASAIVLAHLASTRTAAASFGAISVDNRRILVMEWMAEAITHLSNPDQLSSAARTSLHRLTTALP